MTAQQLELLKPRREEVPDGMIYKCKDMLAAVNLMINTCGMNRKEILYELDQRGYRIAESTFSEVLKGVKNFPLGLLEILPDICNSEILTIWWNNARGYEKPKEKQSEIEKKLVESERRVDALTDVLRDMITRDKK